MKALTEANADHYFMRLEDIVIKLFKGNIRKYGLFIGCNVLTIAILFSLRLLLDNPVLNDPSIVDPMISSNLFAPTLFMYVFAAFFVPFTMVILNRRIQKNYGIMLSMGLSESRFTVCVISENAMTIALSLAGGLASGNLLEIILVRIMNGIIGISGAEFVETKESYFQTIIFLFAVYTISLIPIVLAMKRKSILRVITEERESEEKAGSKGLFALGCALFAVSLIMSFLFYKRTGGNALLIGMAISFLSLVLIIGNSCFAAEKLRGRKLFMISDFIYYFKRNIRLVILLTAVIGILIFINIVAVTTGASIEANVSQYNPYDLVFSQGADDESINMKEQLRDCGAEITRESEVAFFYTRSNAVFGADDVNAERGTDLAVPEGQYLFVRSNVLDDGYTHERGDVPQSTEIGGKTFTLAGDEDILLFCRGGGLTDALIILNQRDFDRIAIEAPEQMRFLRLYTFDDLEKTIGVSNQLRDELDTGVASYLDDEVRAKQSSAVLKLLMAYVSVALLMSAGVTLYYKLGAEREKDKEKYRLLRSMGANTGLLRKCARDKLLLISFFPLAIAVVWVGTLALINTHFLNG